MNQTLMNVFSLIFQVEAYPNGNFVGPTIIGNMTPEMEAYQTEIFGPVMCVVNVDTIDEVNIFWNKVSNLGVKSHLPFSAGLCGV